MAFPESRVIAGLTEERWARLQQVASSRLFGLTVVLHGVHSPHNLAACLRSSEAYGLGEAWVVEAPSGFHPSPRVTQGADEWLEIHRYGDASPCLDELVRRGFELWAAEARPGAVPVTSLDFSRKIALVFGNEHDGLPSAVTSACKGSYWIPLHGFSQSLNVSVALAVSLQVAATSRRASLGRPGDLPPEEARAMALRWGDPTRRLPG